MNKLIIYLLIIFFTSCNTKKENLLNLNNCDEVNKQIIVDRIDIKIKLPNFIIADTGHYEKRNIFYNRLIYAKDSSRLGDIYIYDTKDYIYGKKTIESLLEEEESLTIDSKIIDKFYRDIKKYKRIEIGYAHYLIYDTRYRISYLRGHIVFIKDSVIQGKIFLEKEIKDSFDLKNDWMDCVYKSLESY